MEKNSLVNIEGTDIFLKKCVTAVDGKKEMEIRVTVFMEEQGFSLESEFDSEEDSSVGYLIYKGETLIGCFNYVERGDGDIFFRRLCFLKEYRGLGCGKHVFAYMEKMLSDIHKPLRITFNGEAYLRDYWIKLGYAVVKEVSEGPGCPPLLLCEKIIK